ncbi:hypothetical protein [Aurantiacibacter poecillastricola]|uniref:hypothetical protein n=1 Tax=Aurantiacibacter poecillastricola TaxID=3064385 RepID=UPI00273E8EB5|nr:hypothetical protein [Aurantiacibacter sp. 219JJ12-13]MDP5260068.1 hypothetical protein [Aurantiacibacter sp. 219JJ12-13]
MRITRRTLLAGAAAIPAAIGLDRLAASPLMGGTVFLYDPALPDAGQRRAAAGWQARAIEGDRIRFAREVIALAPARIEGFTRQADALLIEEVAAEAGYRRAQTKVEGPAIDWVLERRL